MKNSQSACKDKIKVTPDHVRYANDDELLNILEKIDPDLYREVTLHGDVPLEFARHKLITQLT